LLNPAHIRLDDKTLRLPFNYPGPLPNSAVIEYPKSQTPPTSFEKGAKDAKIVSIEAGVAVVSGHRDMRGDLFGHRPSSSDEGD